MSDKSAFTERSSIAWHGCRVHYIEDDDKRTKFYTGLTTFYLFQMVFDFVVTLIQMLQKLPGKLFLMDKF